MTEIDREMTKARKKLKAKRLRTMLVRQMTHDYCLDFIVYYLTENHLDLGANKAPIVTVVTAWHKDELDPADCSNKYVRGIAICSQKDSPNRLDGFNMAARRVLRVMKDGFAPIHLDPDNERLLSIWGKLKTIRLVGGFTHDDYRDPARRLTCASSCDSKMSLLEVAILERRQQRRKDRDARRQERDKIKNGLLAGVIPSANH